MSLLLFGDDIGSIITSSQYHSSQTTLSRPKLSLCHVYLKSELHKHNSLTAEV